MSIPGEEVWADQERQAEENLAVAAEQLDQIRPAKPYRSYQQRTPEWSCTQCPDGGSGQDAEDQARAHLQATGHEVHVVLHAVVILRPDEPAEADR